MSQSVHRHHHHHQSTTSLPVAYRISKIVTHNQRTKSFFLEGKPMCVQPGQFVMVWLPEEGEKPFSLAGSNPLRLTVVDVGAISHAIHQLQVGDQIWLRGPLGNPFALLKNKKVLLAAGGYGAAPLLFLGKKLIQAGCEVTAWVGVRSKSDLVLFDEMTEAGIDANVCTDDGSFGLHGVVTLGINQSLENAKFDMVYACGPTRMLQAVAETCKAHEVDCQLSWEALMRCGMGLCGSCELDAMYGEPEGWLVCLDGPVSKRSYSGENKK